MTFKTKTIFASFVCRIDCPKALREAPVFLGSSLDYRGFFRAVFVLSAIEKHHFLKKILAFIGMIIFIKKQRKMA